jgi:hypothetical protein
MAISTMIKLAESLLNSFQITCIATSITASRSLITQSVLLSLPSAHRRIPRSRSRGTIRLGRRSQCTIIPTICIVDFGFGFDRRFAKSQRSSFQRRVIVLDSGGRSGVLGSGGFCGHRATTRPSMLVCDRDRGLRAASMAWVR